ncbi:hypothetical protein LSH36_426g02041 [Paralvinella palmiformis]|uniref:L-Fucosyltransferase n=1 Tax=Paralvinella palmiformis TaxID=53620 RepID=A0AAD9JC88_9ANNE|nr:hypothetical protein LSH36_426g02041 [Paralvinella palmiformis]
MEYFKTKYNKVQFIVASDDLDWCKENIKDQHIIYYNHDSIMDLAILSFSNHIITSIGTYSWWVGWLCRGTTIYYNISPPVILVIFTPTTVGYHHHRISIITGYLSNKVIFIIWHLLRF